MANVSHVIAADQESSIGRILLDSGKLTPEQAERVLRFQKEKGVRFGEAAKSLGFITDADIQYVLAQQFDYPYLQPNQGGYTHALVAAYQPFTPQVEMLRAIRSQLMLRWFSEQHKSLVIVAVDAEDGASLFTANLAVVFSQLGEKTLLVDANLRTPQQQQIFKIKGNQGLSDVLADRAHLDAVIEKVDPLVDLSILSAGTVAPNPQELLSRDNFISINKELASRFDVILMDSAPFKLGADTLTLAGKVGGVLLVARKHITRVQDIAKMADSLKYSGCQVVGSVLLEF
jgi:chain length determinant protein tyrosine kinase EpsG